MRQGPFTRPRSTHIRVAFVPFALRAWNTAVRLLHVAIINDPPRSVEGSRARRMRPNSQQNRKV